MNKPVPKGVVVQPTSQPTTDLHKGVSGQLNQMGHTVTPQSVNPEPELPQFLDDTTRVIGGMSEETISGANTMTHTGTAPGKNFLKIAKQRIAGLFKKA